ncbi:MAG: DUF1266 domain-containing protein [Porphyromonas sp.]|nr:DUF1266 domain-containing protein [Porphyromonas sp.]
MKALFLSLQAFAQSDTIPTGMSETLPTETQTSPDYTTYVLILIGIIFVGYFFVSRRRMFANLFRAITGKFNVTSNNPLSTEKQRQILLGAIFSSQQNARLDTLKLHIDSKQRSMILDEWWDIQSTEDALETLDNLRDKGHRYFFPHILEAMKQSDDKAKGDVILAHFEEEEEIGRAVHFFNNLSGSIEAMKKEGTITSIEDLERIGVNGWDIGRMSFIARACYDAGYIDEETAWNYLQEADRLAHEKLDSWKSLAESYVVGRYLWGGINADSSLIRLYATELCNKPESPWNKIAF